MLTELQIETIVAETCGTYRTGGSYTFEDVWNCIEKALAAHNAGAQEPVAWRHSKTLCLYETKDAVPLADGDEWAEPLYAHPQPMPQTDAARDTKDAKRYRLLRERHFVRADNPNTSAYHCVGVFTSWLPAATIDRDGLDAALDDEIERLDREKGE